MSRRSPELPVDAPEVVVREVSSAVSAIVREQGESVLTDTLSGPEPDVAAEVAAVFLQHFDGQLGDLPGALPPAQAAQVREAVTETFRAVAGAMAEAAVDRGSDVRFSALNGVGAMVSGAGAELEARVRAVVGA